MSNFCHIHRHSEFSPLDGTGNANQYAHEAAKKGQIWLNITDHGRLGGVLDHIDACRNPEKYDNPDDPTEKRSADERLIPLVGMEAYWRDNRFDEVKHTYANHLTLTAGSLRGWRSLIRLSSLAWVPRGKGGGHYGKPCIDWEIFEKYCEDIIVSSACFSSPVSEAILRGDDKYANDFIQRMVKLTDGRFWFEIMPHDFDQQRQVNIEKINLANKYGLGVIATADAHTPYKDWVDTQSIVRMISYRQTFSKREKKKEAGEDTYTEETDTIFLSSRKEMLGMFKQNHPDIPISIIKEALDNTVEFAKSVKPFMIGKTAKLPQVSSSAKSAEKTLRKWCEDGLRRIGKHKDDVYRDRYQYEFNVLKNNKVIDYFILVGDLVRWAKSDAPLPPTEDDPEPKKKRPIRVGLGRGSAAGCLISYLVGITSIDPIAWKLLFERFLNPDRVGLPDIDLDFETEFEILDGMDGRDLVKAYLSRKYGHDHVADIIAYQTFAPKAVIQNVSSVYDLNPNHVHKITDTIGDTERELEKIVKENEVVQKFKDDYPEIWKHCIRLEDQIKNDSRHASGVIITRKPVTSDMPTQTGKDETSIVTAWADRAEFPIVSDYGWLKLDVLGVRGLSKQQFSVNLIKEYYDEEVEPNNLPALRDPYDVDGKVIDGFIKGLTIGVFQFGGRGITQLLRHIKPDNAIDIAVANALYRPGPIKIAFEYGDRKNGKVPTTYWHDSLEPILNETLGLIAFQEQVMEITKQIGNFSGGDADSMRKAISKLYRLPGDKAREFMEQWRDKWMQGCRDNNIDDADALHIWNMILEFAGYGFNKSHSASYALQAYQDMWLKVIYPLAFYPAVLTLDKKKNAAETSKFRMNASREAQVLGVTIAPPDINMSNFSFTVAKNKVVFGLGGIKNVGQKQAMKVIEARPFKSLDDFFKKIPSNTNAGAISAMAKAGAFDSLESREVLLSKVPKRADGKKQYKVSLSCGCVKIRTGEDKLKKLYLNPQPCDSHKDSKILVCDEQVATYTYIEHLKNSPKFDPPSMTTPSRAEIIAFEKEYLGLPLSVASEISSYQNFIQRRIYTEEEIEQMPTRVKSRGHRFPCWCAECDKSHAVIGGEIVDTKIITTKTNRVMAFFDVTFGVNQWNCTIFPDHYDKFHELIHENELILAAGFKDKEGSLLIYQVEDVRKLAKEVTRDKKLKKKKLKIKRKAVA